MAAGIETLRHIREGDYLERTVAAGRRLREGLQQQAAAHGFTLSQSGPVQMPMILFEDDPDFRLGYAWVAEALKRGVYLHPYHNMFFSAAHSLDDIATALAATDDAFAAVKRRGGQHRAASRRRPDARPALSAPQAVSRSHEDHEGSRAHEGRPPSSYAFVLFASFVIFV